MGVITLRCNWVGLLLCIISAVVDSNLIYSKWNNPGVAVFDSQLIQLINGTILKSQLILKSHFDRSWLYLK